MTQFQRELSQVSVSSKTFTIKKEKRQKEIDQLFSTIRKKMAHTHCQLEVDGQRQQQTAVLDHMIAELAKDPRKPITELWSYSLSFSYRYFTEQHIKFLTQRLTVADSQDKEQQVTMLVVLIYNWTSSTRTFNSDFSDLFALLASLMTDNRNRKLNQFILFSLGNFCLKRSNGKILMSLQIVDAVVRRAVSRKLPKEDVCIFLNNVFESLPIQYPIDSSTLQSFLEFLKLIVPRDLNHHHLTQDIICLLKKLLTINSGSYFLTIVQFFPSQIQTIAQLLQNTADCTCWYSILELLQIVYKGPLDIRSPLSSPAFCQNLWATAQNFLLTYDFTPFAQKQSQIELFRQSLWSFLEAFLRVPFEGNFKALAWLKGECVEGQWNWQQRALKVLIKTLDSKSALELMELKLGDVQFLDEPTKTMLEVLLRIIKNKESQFRDKHNIRQIITNLKCDSREDIALLACQLDDWWIVPVDSESHTDRQTMFEMNE